MLFSQFTISNGLTNLALRSRNFMLASRWLLLERGIDVSLASLHSHLTLKLGHVLELLTMGD